MPVRSLELLQTEYASPRPSLIVLYGRRRVGKSTLILESLCKYKHVYHQASRLTDPDNLNLFKRSLETTGSKISKMGLNSRRTSRSSKVCA